MAKTTTAKAGKRQAAEQSQPTAIPLPIRDGQPQPDDPLAAMVDQLAASAKEPEPKKEEERPEIVLTDEARKAFLEFIPAKEWADILTARAKTTQAELGNVVFPLWVEKVWTSKTQPPNPRLVINRSDGKPDIVANYQVQAKFSVQGKNAAETVKLLGAVGLSDEEAQKVVSEIDFRPDVNTKSFKALTGKDAKPEEKAVAEKLMRFILSLPEAERELILDKKTDPEVRDGFLKRVATYVTSKDRLAAIFKVIKPTHFPSQTDFAVSDSPPEKTERLIAEARKILGMKFSQPPESPKKKKTE